MADEKPDPVADNPDVQEARIAQAIAEANQATLKASLPSPAAQPLEGKVEVSDKSGFFGDLLAYAAMERAVDSLANVVPETATSVFVVEDRNLVGSEWMRTLMEGQIEQHATAVDSALSALTEERGEVMTDSVTAALTAAPLVIGAVADLVGMFKTDYAMHGRATTISATALLAETAGKLAGRGITVKLDSFAFIADSSLVASFESLREKLTSLRNALTRLNETEVNRRQLEIDDLVKTIDGAEKTWGKAVETEKAAGAEAALKRLAELRAERRALADKLAPEKAKATQAEAVVKAADEFVKAAVTATADAPPPILAAAIRERLKDVSHVLFVSTEAAGDEAVTRHGLFAKSGIVGYIGGCNVSYLILDVAADKVTGGSGSWIGHTRYDLKDGNLSPPTFTRLG